MSAINQPLMQHVAILGATGTIGLQTLNVISQHPQLFKVFALTANSNVQGMLDLCRQHTPQYAVMLDIHAANSLQQALSVAGCKTIVLSGKKALTEIASHDEVDVVMAAIVGAAGLHPAMAAAHAGKRILLANKETLVMAGNLFMQAVEKGGATLLPIDSEHNAIFQVMPHRRSKDLHEMGIRRIILTASGGPFRNFTKDEMYQVTLGQALNHPNWVMGPKITIDSASMMNKGLEVIEAHWLFNAPAEKIEVVVHPQSVIHSMVEYTDGSVLAQLSNPDMRTPIAYGLGYPHRLESGVSSLDLLKIGRLDFVAPDMERFPCLQLAYHALRAEGTAPAILNAANEVAVEAFLSEQIGFMEIAELIESVLEKSVVEKVSSIEQLVEVDSRARNSARAFLMQHA